MDGGLFYVLRRERYKVQCIVVNIKVILML
jgi:hypothetical protein